MNRINISLLIYTIFISLTIIFLVSIGESRLDTYISISILIYFIYTSIDLSIRSRTNLKILDIALITIFIAIVLARVLIILEII